MKIDHAEVLTGTVTFVTLIKVNKSLRPPSSRGLGHLPFTEATGIRIPLGVLKALQAAVPIFFACMVRPALDAFPPLGRAMALATATI